MCVALAWSSGSRWTSGLGWGHCWCNPEVSEAGAALKRKPGLFEFGGAWREPRLLRRPRPERVLVCVCVAVACVEVPKTNTSNRVAL
jgi:hypothetical protein